MKKLIAATVSVATIAFMLNAGAGHATKAPTKESMIYASGDDYQNDTTHKKRKPRRDTMHRDTTGIRHKG